MSEMLGDRSGRIQVEVQPTQPCSHCNKKISGVYYSCMDCVGDLLLCAKCESSKIHDPAHSLAKQTYFKPSSDPS